MSINLSTYTALYRSKHFNILTKSTLTMILRNVSAYSPIQSGRYIPYWRRVIDSIHRQLDLSKNRYLLSDQRSTPSMQFVRIVLDSFDYSILGDKDIFDDYYQYILPESTMIGKKFYPLVNTPRINRFCDKPIHEIMLPTNGLVGSKLSPLDNWNRWEPVRPMRLVAHDSMEFSLPEDQLYFRFKKDKPIYMVFCIDIAALILKFIKFVQNSGMGYDAIDRDVFVRDHILSYIYDDIADCWLMNFLAACMENDDDVFDKLLEMSKYNQYVGISSLNLAYNDIRDLINRINDKKITLSAILDTELFQDTKLSDVMNLHEKNMVVGTDNRSIGFELIKSSVLLNILVNIIELQPELTTKIRRQFGLEYGIIRRSGWKSHILNSELRDVAQQVESTLVLAT